METLTTNRSTVILDDLGRWVTGYGQASPDVGNPHIGARYFDTDDQKEYFWTGSAWSEVESNPNFNTEYWEDLRFPAQGINPLGAASDPAVSAVTGMLHFSGTKDNVIGGIAQMPHAWKRGSAIYPHIHVLAVTPGAAVNSRWKFEYNRANNNEAFENAYGTYTTLSTVTIANPNSADTLLLPDGFGELTMSAYHESCCVMWKITRLANTDVLDNDTNLWALIEFDIHYQVEKTGTTTRNPV